MFVSIFGYSQNYVENNYYESRGAEQIICGNPYFITNGFGYIETWQNCRKMVWCQSYYSGNVYYWSGYSWCYRFQQGNYWYYYWYDYNVRIR